jgi:hypothetical protein
MSTASLAQPSLPLVAMITVAAGSRIAALKIKNLTVFDAGTTSHHIIGELVDGGIEAGMEDRHQ